MNDHTKNRLTVFHTFSGDLWAGAEVMIFNLLKRLKDYPDLRIIALSLNKGTLSDKLQEIGVETYVIPEKTNSFPKILVKTLHLLKGRRIHIIHSHRYKENLLALLLAKLMGVKQLFATLHGVSEPPICRKNAGMPISPKTKIDYFILKRAFSCVVAVSLDIKNILVQQYGFSKAKVEVIYNGIEIPRFTNLSSNRPAHQPFHIGTVGRMVPVKDFDLFLEVAAAIKKKTENVRFSILGDGLIKEQLIHKAKELQIEDSVEFQPPRPNPFPYYQSLDLYLNTSLHEGMPLSILEAMACGKPVVAPKVGGIPEIISHGENGLLVETRESKEFVHSCLSLILQKGLRVSMGKNAIKRVVSRFSSHKMAESYRQLYQQLCRKF